MRRISWFLILVLSLLMGVNAAFAKPVHRKIPPPPIVILPLEKVEPPHNVAAKDWHSPICAAWSDGCTKCERKTAHGKTVCRPVDGTDATCERGLSGCENFNETEMSKYCSASMDFQFNRNMLGLEDYISSGKYSDAILRRAHTVTLWQFKKQKWSSWQSWGNLIVNRKQMQPGYVAPPRPDYAQVCYASWSKEQKHMIYKGEISP